MSEYKPENTDQPPPQSQSPAAKELPEITVEEQAFISEMVALSLTGIVIRKGVVSVRMFSLGGGKTIVAYLLQESTDGFIVALPATLSGNTSGDVRADFISPTPIVKFFKGGTPMMAIPTPSIFYHYLKLSKERFDALPGYFNAERQNQVSMVIEQLKLTHGLDKLHDIVKEATGGSARPTNKTNEEAEDVSDKNSFSVRSPVTKYKH
jgi:hypothetical protein